MQLPAVSIDMATALDPISTLIAFLKHCRTIGNFVAACFTSAVEQCKACDIEMSQPVHSQRIRKLLNLFNNSVVLEFIGHRSDNDSKTDFRQNIYFRFWIV